MSSRNSKQIIQSYLEGKGFKVEDGWTTTRALLNHIAAEHPEVNHPGLLNAKRVAVESVGIARVHLLNREKYDAAEAQPMDNPSGTPKIAGVLVPAGSAYILIDGYGRLKGLNKRGAITATYLVLH